MGLSPSSGLRTENTGRRNGRSQSSDECISSIYLWSLFVFTVLHRWADLIDSVSFLSLRCSRNLCNYLDSTKFISSFRWDHLLSFVYRAEVQQCIKNHNNCKRVQRCWQQNGWWWPYFQLIKSSSSLLWWCIWCTWIVLRTEIVYLAVCVSIVYVVEETGGKNR